MKVLGFLDKSRCGNDCYINEGYSFCESYGMYFIILTLEVTGWVNTKEVRILHPPTNNIKTVHAKWEELGGMSIEAVD